MAGYIEAKSGRTLAFALLVDGGGPHCVGADRDRMDVPVAVRCLARRRAVVRK